MRRFLIAGNWKMNGSLECIDHLLKSIRARANEVTQADLVVFPSYVFLEAASTVLAGTKVAWGGQDVSQEPRGAFTGQVSASMLLDFACRYVIVGHSERRRLCGETDAQVAAKFLTALNAGLCPILCVGESWQERESGQTLSVVSKQLAAVLSLVNNVPDSLVNAVIAYEPIWAIGTGQQPTVEEIQAVHQSIRQQCCDLDISFGERVRILYGGSAQLENAARLLSISDVDGLLLGGASLDAEKFIEISLLCGNLF